MPEDKVRQVPFIQSLDRGLTILQAVALSKQPVSLGDLSELLKVDRSSAFRLAQTLRRRGFLACPTGRKDYILAVAGQTGELVPLYCTAHGKALLADSDERELASQFGSGPLRKYTPST